MLTTRPRVGIVGGGQLARMTAMSARLLDIDVAVLRQPGDEGVEGVVADLTTVAHLDEDRLEDFARRCDVLTFDHEKVAPGVVARLEDRGLVVRPGARAYELASDKVSQRIALSAGGFPLPPFALPGGMGDLDRFADDHDWPLVVKAGRGGYDGAGVHRVEQAAEAPPFRPWQVVAEPHLAIETELAVLVARRPGGQVAVYPAVATHQDATAICRRVVAPAPVSDRLRRRAEDLAVAVADHIDATGILAVELFVVDGDLLINELAARPHNTGHLTIEGSATSQFENHLRAVLDLPLGPTTPMAPWAVMVNLIAADDRPVQLPRRPGTRVHLYGKTPRPGRKVGHVTALGADLGEVLARAEAVAEPEPAGEHRHLVGAGHS